MLPDNLKIKAPKILINKKPSVTICSGGLIRNSYEKQTISSQNVQAKVRFNRNSFDSINIPEIKFSNMLTEKMLVPPKTQSAINKLKDNPEIINIASKEVNLSRDSDGRMKQILGHYLNEDECDIFYDDFRKSEIKDSDIVMETHGDFRVITIYSIEKNEQKVEQYLTVIFLDPYHLFIPSKHKGLTKEQAMENKYQEVKDYSYHIKEHFPL